MPRIKKAAWVLDTPEAAFNEQSLGSVAATQKTYNRMPEHKAPAPAPGPIWFIRSHREKLVKSKVLLILVGRKVIDAEIMDALVLETWHRQAEAASE